MAEKENQLVCNVAAVLSDTQLVINKGSLDQIYKNFRFLIYNMGPEIMDPITNQSLGNLEIVKGIGRVIHVQEKMATIESDTFEKNDVITTRTPTLGRLLAQITAHEEVLRDNKKRMLPFENPVVGDFAKYIP